MKKMMFIALAAATFTFASCWTNNKTDDQEPDGTEQLDPTATTEGEEAVATDSTAKVENATEAENAEAPAEGTDAPAEAAPAADAK